jgi:hypothetical protein
MGDDRLSPRTPRLVAAVAAAAALLTLLVPLFPAGQLAIESAPLHVAIDTTISVIALVAGALLIGRFRETRALDDLLLAAAFTLLLLVNICFSTIPALTGFSVDRFGTWSAAVGRVSGAAVLAAAGFCPPRRLVAPTRSIVVMLAVCTGVVAAIGGAALLLVDALPVGVRDASHLTRGAGASLSAEAVLLALNLGGALIFAAATVGLVRRALRSNDQLLYWIAALSALSALAYLN